MTHHRELAETVAAPFLDPGAFARGQTWVGAGNQWLEHRLQDIPCRTRESDKYSRDPGGQGKFRICQFFRRFCMKVPRSGDTVQISRGRAARDAAAIWRSTWPDPSSSILSAFAQYASTILRNDGPHASLWPNPALPGEEILRWRHLSLRLPPGIFLAAAAAQDGSVPNLRISLLGRWLVPRGPLAHTHVHWNAALDFEAVWAHLMSGCDAVGDTIGPKGFASAWPAWIDVVRVARLALQDALVLGKPAADFATAARRLVAHDADVVADALQCLASGQLAGDWLPPPRSRSGGLAILRRALARNRLVSPGGPGNKSEVWARDPLYVGAPWPEGAFMAQVWRRTSVLSADDDWHRLFVQYLRVKCALYCHLVQDPQHTGLQAFIATFNRLKPYRLGLENLRLDHVLDEPDLGGALQAVEIRQDPKEPRELSKVCNDLATRSTAVPQLGVLLHLIRDGSKPGAPESLRSRYFRMNHDAQNACVSLQTDPRRLRWIRGIDLAGDERAGPLWQAVPHLKAMLAAGRKAAADSGLPPLRLTLHVGEDFAHLTTGLRAIHEPTAWGLIEPGDRLGHALALTLDPLRWAADHVEVEQPLADRLFDLAWLLAIARGVYLSEDHVVCGAPLPPHSEARLAQAWRDELARADVHIDVDPMAFHRGFAEPDFLREWVTIGPIGNPLHRLFAMPFQAPGHASAFAGATDLFAPVTVHTLDDAQLLTAVRRRIANDLLRRQVAIEVNPTSNLVVAGFRHLLEQPMLHLHPLEPRRKTGPDAGMPVLPVALHADDPLTFATNLSDEYAYAWAGMVAAGGADPQHVRAWLDEAAAVSWAWRFTIDSDH